MLHWYLYLWSPSPVTFIVTLRQSLKTVKHHVRIQDFAKGAKASGGQFLSKKC